MNTAENSSKPEFKIVFGRLGKGIMSVNSDGTGLTTIFKEGEMPNVSPDLTKIVFTSALQYSNQPLSGEDAKFYLDKLDPIYSLSRISGYPLDNTKAYYINSIPEVYLMDGKDDSILKILASEDIRGAGASFPKFSRDGNKIALKETKDGKSQIRVIDMNAHRMYILIPDQVPVSYFCWLSDEKIYFETTKNLKAVVHTTDHSVEAITIFESGDYEPLWDRKGEKVAFCNGSDLFVMDSNGRNRQRLTEIRGWIGDWSPDSQWIVFSSRKMNGNGADIFIIRKDGKGESRLTEGNKDFDPCWISL